MARKLFPLMLVLAFLVCLPTIVKGATPPEYEAVITACIDMKKEGVLRYVEDLSQCIEGKEMPIAWNMYGPKPEHQWDGTSLSFKNPDGTWDVPVDLVGPQGPAGPAGECTCEVTGEQMDVVSERLGQIESGLVSGIVWDHSCEEGSVEVTGFEGSVTKVFGVNNLVYYVTYAEGQFTPDRMPVVVISPYGGTSIYDTYFIAYMDHLGFEVVFTRYVDTVPQAPCFSSFTFFVDGR